MEFLRRVKIGIEWIGSTILAVLTGFFLAFSFWRNREAENDVNKRHQADSERLQGQVEKKDARGLRDDILKGAK